jgi:hypothetical protein
MLKIHWENNNGKENYWYINNLMEGVLYVMIKKNKKLRRQTIGFLVIRKYGKLSRFINNYK